jgi:hydroxymethylbilane synthase
VCQLRAARADLALVPLRGNVDTRLRKLDAGELDAVILACAGLRRLGHAARITRALAPEESLPAIGQGALALECRADDAQTRARLEPFNHAATERATAAERAFLARLQGGCQTPLAAYATLAGETLTLRGLVAATDGSQRLADTRAGRAVDAEALGRALAEALLARGADRLLAAATATPEAAP